MEDKVMSNNGRHTLYGVGTRVSVYDRAKACDVFGTVVSQLHDWSSHEVAFDGGERRMVRTTVLRLLAS